MRRESDPNSGPGITWNKCHACGLVQIPDRVLCRQCGSPDFEPVHSGPHGHVVSHTHCTALPPALSHLSSATFVVVELSHGIRVMGRLLEGEASTGAPVVLEGDPAVPCFSLDRGETPRE